MLVIKGITKQFGGVTALNHCSFSVQPQKITALIGPNGAGKTTLIDAISGLINVDSGSISYEDQNILGMKPHQITRFGITRTWQQARLFKYLSIEDHLKLAADQDDTSLLKSLFADDRHFRTETMHAGNLELETKDLGKFARHFGIEKPLNTSVNDLSYGQRKLLQLAMAVLQPHKILLLDEPVAGVGRQTQQKIEKILQQLRTGGDTIVLIEHNMDFVEKLADTVVVLDAGSVLTQGDPKKVLKNKQVLEAYLGE
jgi:ABC-type branched-subunit amino acid transport system ATPase component